jgi:hypothetical protein
LTEIAGSDHLLNASGSEEISVAIEEFMTGGGCRLWQCLAVRCGEVEQAVTSDHHIADREAVGDECGDSIDVVAAAPLGLTSN